MEISGGTRIAHWVSCELKVGAALLKVMSQHGNKQMLPFCQGVTLIELILLLGVVWSV